jgi:hypothetical protein
MFGFLRICFFFVLQNVEVSCNIDYPPMRNQNYETSEDDVIMKLPVQMNSPLFIDSLCLPIFVWGKT